MTAYRVLRRFASTQRRFAVGDSISVGDLPTDEINRLLAREFIEPVPAKMDAIEGVVVRSPRRRRT